MDQTRLARAIIINMQTNERLSVMYNPEEYQLEQGNNFAEIGVPGLNAPPLQYVRGSLRVLSMELFFDTYEQRQDVRYYTGKIVGLLDKLTRTSAPPILVFSMGQFHFQCVLAQAGQRFTMFLQDGTPVRAILSVRFQEYQRAEIQIQQGLSLGPPTLHRMVEGQTLSGIAATYLGDPLRWREIAETNNIDDPLHVSAGFPLVIPEKLRS